MHWNYKEIDYSHDYQIFIDKWLDKYDYNEKAVKIEPFKLWFITIKELLETDYCKKLEKKEKFLLVKCLGHNIGVWDLHSYFDYWFNEYE